MKKILVVGAILVLSLVFWGLPSKTEAVADNTWIKNSTEVVVNNQAGWPRVIKDDTTYKMWVEDPADGTIRYMASADGITWGALQATNLDGQAGNLAHEFSIIKDGATYKMWFNSGPPATVSYRTSADGLTWSAATLVVFNGGGQAWDLDYIAPWVIKDGSTYKMWYNAAEGNGQYYYAYATSDDGTTFTEPQNLGKIISAAGNTNNNLVLKQGDAGTWDGYQAGEALYSNTIFKNSDGIYEMWYAGNKSGQAGGADGYKIGYATSSDGISWTKSNGNPVLGGGGTTGGFDDNGVYYPTVIQDGNTYKMWYWPYANWQGGVGYATANKAVAQAATVVTLPATGGGDNIVTLVGLTLLLVSAPVFYLFQRKTI